MMFRKQREVNKSGIRSEPNPHFLSRHVKDAHQLLHSVSPRSSCVLANPFAMSYSGRPLPSRLHHPAGSTGQSTSSQSPVLLARINEKKAELANLKELQILSAGLADQMQTLEEKLATLSDGTEGEQILLRVMKGATVD